MHKPNSQAAAGTRMSRLRRNASLSALIMASALCIAAPNAAFALYLEATSGQTKTASDPVYDDAYKHYGVYANGGTINFDTAGTIINMSHGSGTTPSWSSAGLVAANGGTVNINAATIVNASGTSGSAVHVFGGGTINLNANLTINITDAGGGIPGLRVYDGSTLTSVAGARLIINASGIDSNNAFSIGEAPGSSSTAASTVNLAGGADITSSAKELGNSYLPNRVYKNAVLVGAYGTLTGNDVNITMTAAASGDARATALAVFNGGVVNLTNSTITSASTGNAVDIQTGSNVTLTNVTLRTLDDAAHGYSETPDVQRAGRGRGASIIGGTLTLDHSRVTTNTSGPQGAYLNYQADGYGVAVSDYLLYNSTTLRRYNGVANIQNGTTIDTSGDRAVGLLVATYWYSDFLPSASDIPGAAIANVTGSFIKTTGADASGLRVMGGTANVDATSTITTTGAGAIGVDVQNIASHLHPANVATNSVANITGTSVTTSGANAHGLSVSTGTANISAHATFSTSGDGAIGATLVGSSATVAIANIDASTLRTTGANAHGLNVTGGTANVSNASAINTSGAGAFGVRLAGSSATIAIANIDASTVVTTGTDAYGLNVTGGTANVTNASAFTTSGTGSTGVRLAGANATRAIANIDASNVTTTGDNARGVDVEGGTANLTAGTKITTIGANAAGLYANSANAIINADASRVTTVGADSPGLHAVDGGKIVFSNGRVTTSDASSAGIVTSGATGGSLVKVTNAVISTPGDAIQTSGGASEIDFTGVATMPGSGVLLNAQATSTTFSADSSALTGSMILGAGTSVVTLKNGTVWNMTADSVVTSLTNDDSTIAFSAPTGDPMLLTSYRTLSVNNYTGNNGTIRLNTYLGGDGSASDRLVIDGGTATGTTLLDIRNTGGPGALTNADGIMVVQSVNNAVTNTGSDDQTTFKLSRRVAAGAYEYDLYANGVTDPNDQNWYLRGRTLPADPTAASASGPTPRVLEPRPEVPTNATIMPQALQFGYAMLGSADSRNGLDGETAGNAGTGSALEERSIWCRGLNPHNRQAATDPKNRDRCIVRLAAVTQDETRWTRSGWAYVIGARGIHDRDNYFRHGPDYDYTFGGIKAGLDMFARQKADGTLDKAGVYVGYGQISSNVYGPRGASYGNQAGTVGMDAYTLGGYWTHRAPQGWYTDIAVQGTWYTDTAAKSVLNETISPDGFGILGSLEGGYEFRLGSGWALTPQAQIVYGNVAFDGARDSFGIYRFEDGDTLRSRLGARLAKTWQSDDPSRPRPVTAFLRANIWHEFLGNAKSVVTDLYGENALITASPLKGTWGEIGTGVKAQVSDSVSLFAAGNYQHSLDGRKDQSWDGRLGISARW